MSSRFTDADIRATGLHVVSDTGACRSIDAVGTTGFKASVEVSHVVDAFRPLADMANGKPNATEIEALTVLRLGSMAYEGRTFDVVGHRYTPDWYGNGMAVEVKGEFIHSRDSRILFDAARLAHPEITWIWARKRTKGRKGKRWEVEVY